MQETGVARALLLALVAGMVSASSAVGQTRLFEPWQVEVGVSAYATIEECMAAFERVQEGLEIHGIQTTHVVPDTMPFDPAEGRRPLPPEVVETVQVCLNAASGHADTVAVNAWKLLAPLYLSAGMDDRARAVVNRRLAAIEPDDTDELKLVLNDAVLKVYFGARPRRYELAEEVVLEHVDRLPKLTDRLSAFRVLLRFPYAETGGDLNEDSEAGARGRRLMALIKSMLDATPRSELQSTIDEAANVNATPEEFIEQLQAESMLLVGRSFLRDTLRVSTEAYVKAVRESYAQGYRRQPPELALLGERAPRLEGDVWLGCEQDPCEPYPRSGRVTLVWFGAEGSTCFPYDLRLEKLDISRCVERIPLRRLQNRFPELDVVVVTQSTGRYAYVKDGMTLEREAQLIRKWLDTFGLDRAVLSMTETQGWRLPEPDGRWAVRHETANRKNYFPEPGSNMSALLIDQDGYVVHMGSLIGLIDILQILNEEEFVKLIEILLER